MSRLDFFTIFVVALCILAIVFLIFKATELAKGGNVDVPEDTSIVTDIDSDLGDEDSLYDTEESGSGSGVAGEMDGEATSDLSETTGTGGDTETDEADFEESASGQTNNAAEAETPTTEREPEVISSDASLGKYLVLAGTFKMRANADNLVRTLKNAGYSNAKTSIFDKGTYAVVLVDRFDNKSEATALESKLKSGGHEAYIQLAVSN